MFPTGLQLQREPIDLLWLVITKSAKLRRTLPGPAGLWRFLFTYSSAFEIYSEQLCSNAVSVSGVVFKAGTWSLVRVRHLPGAARAGAMQGCADGGEECCTFTASAALVSCMSYSCWHCASYSSWRRFRRKVLCSRNWRTWSWVCETSWKPGVLLT